MPATQSDLLKNAAEVTATVVVAIAGLSAIAYSRRLAREKAESSTSGSLMEEFQRAYDSGEMSAEEFQRVRNSLTGRKAKSTPSAKAPAVGLPPHPMADNALEAEDDGSDRTSTA